MLWLFLGLLLFVVITAGPAGFDAIEKSKKRRIEKARAKQALRQKSPAVSKYAVLNPAELKAKRY